MNPTIHGTIYDHHSNFSFLATVNVLNRKNTLTSISFKVVMDPKLVQQVQSVKTNKNKKLKLIKKSISNILITAKINLSIANLFVNKIKLGRLLICFQRILIIYFSKVLLYGSQRPMTKSYPLSLIFLNKMNKSIIDVHRIVCLFFGIVLDFVCRTIKN